MSVEGHIVLVLDHHRDFDSGLDLDSDRVLHGLGVGVLDLDLVRVLVTGFLSGSLVLRMLLHRDLFGRTSLCLGEGRTRIVASVAKK